MKKHNSICKDKEELHASNISIWDVNVIDDKVTIPVSKDKVEKTNIKVTFLETEEVPVSDAIKYEGLLLTLNYGASGTITIRTDETPRYKAFSKTINVTRENLAPLTLKELTIHGISASSGNITIPTYKDKVEVVFDIVLKFNET